MMKYLMSLLTIVLKNDFYMKYIFSELNFG